MVLMNKDRLLQLSGFEKEKDLMDLIEQIDVGKVELESLEENKLTSKSSKNFDNMFGNYKG